MYVKSITLDGFKSYAQRTEVTGFDPLFNAITGLNGSGKSNILDSICFVLGISNLSQVRATNLQELVYKNGQAGITKASVSIVFDNSDKKQSPMGYEQYDELTVTRQVVVGGRNKYLINGSNANNTRVQDLFRSVQLNVNNPHFLIMQGRITKVLNMKPLEILSMIEEAAGTRLYESKKEMAQKTIEKKEAKLNEIDTILREEITPTLAKLKNERSSYLEYQKILRELEHLNRLYIAYQFVCAEETKQKSIEEFKEMQNLIESLKARLNEIDVNIEDLSQVIEELEKKKAEEEAGVLGELETKLKEKQKDDAYADSALDSKKETLKSEQNKEKVLQKQHASDEATLKSKQKDLGEISGTFEKLESDCQDDAKALEVAQRHLHAVSAGLSSNKDGEEASLNDQLLAAKNDISKAETEKKQSEIRLTHAREEITKKKSDLKKTELGYKKDQQAHQTIKANIDKIQADMKKLGFDEARRQVLHDKQKKLKQEVDSLQNKVETMQSRYPNLQFTYQDPENNFNRKKVHGVLAKLIKIKDVSTATALEVVAGGKLYNVIIDTEQTGKKLLKDGQLQRRVTFSPLNKIAGQRLTPEMINTAENLVGKKNVHTSLSLVDYDKELERAIVHAFGSSFVCDDDSSAKKVTYDPKIMKKSVSLKGDMFDPAGTLTGGSRSQGSSLLLNLSQLIEAEECLAQKKHELNQVELEINELQKTTKQYETLKQRCELQVQEAQHLEVRMAQSSHGVQLDEIRTLQTTIDEQEEVSKTAKDTSKKAKDKVKDLEYKIKNAKSLREEELKEAESQLQQTKKKADKSSKDKKSKQQDVDSLRMEIDELNKDLASCSDQMQSVHEAMAGFDTQINQLKEAQALTKVAVKEAQNELAKLKEQLKACSKEINAKESEQHKLANEKNEIELRLQDLDHQVTKHKKETKEAANTVENMLKNYEWIVDERQYFGQSNTAYDFKANDPKEAGRRIQKLRDTKDKLSKNVNMRAMNMLGKAEEQYNDLMKKKKIVLNDKAKIAAVIAELDEKKNEALKTASTKVNKDFGSIFCMLLPGTQAKLAPPEGQSVLEGLEVKVAFGDVWKESLSELSGGQRSLVALSLILAMLLFKPAPIYILDEVDAALDLSHTQNIGQMLKSHFKHSQFIVVSLKDGMFNNANVLFKTKFVDGVSTVKRYVQNNNKTGSVSSVQKDKAAKQNNHKRLRLD